MVVDKSGSIASPQAPAVDLPSRSPAAKDSHAALPGTSGNPSAEQVTQAAHLANQRLELAQSQIRFNISNESGITVVRMVDTRTREVLMQIPHAQMMQIAQDLDKHQGLALQKQA